MDKHSLRTMHCAYFDKDGNIQFTGKPRSGKEKKEADIIYGICVMAIFICCYFLILMAWACQQPIN